MSESEPRLAWGPELTPEGARFRLWAPGERAVRLRLEGRDFPMSKEDDGWFETAVAGAAPGAAYAFVLDDGSVVPDPASRAQVSDVHGPSRLVDPNAYTWRHDWRGRPWHEAVIYELHVGTFTEAGTFRAAIDRLPGLADIGITAIELMPVAQFAGSRGWGYDGVLPYAPHTAYGTPDDLKALVDAAHGAGLMVLLDVVYNHFGPDGNYLSTYAPDFFHPERHTPWGGAIAYERPPVRRFFIDNARYWLERVPLRRPAPRRRRPHPRPRFRRPRSSSSSREAVRAAFPDRPVHLTTEDNRNITRLHERDARRHPPPLHGGVERRLPQRRPRPRDRRDRGLLRATSPRTTGPSSPAPSPRASPTRASPRPMPAAPRAACRAPTCRPPPSSTSCRTTTRSATAPSASAWSTSRARATVSALTAILLLSPHIPLLFMGEEWGETRPFAFFTDFHGDLADVVREGRRREFRHFTAFHDPDDAAPASPTPTLPCDLRGIEDRLGRARDPRGRATGSPTSPQLLAHPPPRDRPAPRRAPPATAAASSPPTTA